MPRSSLLTKTITWRAPEYLFKRKTLIWYANVFIPFFLVIALLFWIQNYLGVGIVSLLFWYFIAQSNTKPRVVTYTINKDGLSIGDRHIGYSEIRSFNADVSQSAPLLVFELNYHLAMPLTMLVKKQDLEEVLDFLQLHIPLRNDFSLIRWVTHHLHY